MSEGPGTGAGMDVGVVGLGRMGAPMALRLVRAGHTVHVANRSPASVDALAGQGALAAESAAYVAARAEVVLTVLPTQQAVLQVFGQMAREARKAADGGAAGVRAPGGSTIRR